MTNSQIIMNNSIALAEAGILKIGADGLPETIHTYEGWRSIGFQVQKGQKAVAKFAIWKHTPARTKKDGTEMPEGMFLKTSAWFTADQVAAME